jgi:hypothetical protein
MSAEVIISSRGIHVSCRPCGLHEPADDEGEADAIAELHDLSEHAK